MRIAVLSDVHCEPARARGRAGGDRRGRLRRDLVPRRPRRLRAEAERVRGAAAGARRDLPGRQPRPRRARQDPDRRRSPARPRPRPAGRRRCSTTTARAFLDTLEPQAVAPGAELFHGSPRDPVWDYVLSDESGARARSRLTEAPLVLVGHSHVALEISDGDELRGEPAPAGTTARARRRCGGCSTRARSASRATATRGPHGWRLTLGRAGQPFAVPTIRSSGRRRRCERRVYPRLSRCASRTASSSAPTRGAA